MLHRGIPLPNQVEASPSPPRLFQYETFAPGFAPGFLLYFSTVKPPMDANDQRLESLCPVTCQVNAG